jgi:hypothetical protein
MDRDTDITAFADLFMRFMREWHTRQVSQFKLTEVEAKMLANHDTADAKAEFLDKLSKNCVRVPYCDDYIDYPRSMDRLIYPVHLAYAKCAGKVAQQTPVAELWSHVRDTVAWCIKSAHSGDFTMGAILGLMHLYQADIGAPSLYNSARDKSEFLVHMSRVMRADMQFPIIICYKTVSAAPYWYIVDGYHRLCRAAFEMRPTIATYVLSEVELAECEIGAAPWAPLLEQLCVPSNAWLQHPV